MAKRSSSTRKYSRQAVNRHLSTVSFAGMPQQTDTPLWGRGSIGGERDDQTLWYVGRQWVEHSSPKLHRCTYNLRTIGTKDVFSRANVKQNTRSLDISERLPGFEDRQLSPTEEVKVPCRLCRTIA